MPTKRGKRNAAALLSACALAATFITTRADEISSTYIGSDNDYSNASNWEPRHRPEQR